MSVDDDTVRRIARLARIALDDKEVPLWRDEINGVLKFAEQLNEVNVENVEPMTSVTPMRHKMRPDKVTDGGIPDKVLANAPVKDNAFFLVPKVVE